MNYSPIIIIGAGRSGTNMLRDMLTAFPGVGTWPCDEINYIWRHGNARYATDEFPPELARPRVRAYIRRAFDRLAARRGLSHVVEKTCANSLRVQFVRAVVPEARFIHIVRDGRDVAVSAVQRWTAELDLRYVLRKARFVPPADLPYYAGRYLWNRIYRIVTRGERLAFWGPRFVGMEEALEEHPLPVACAIQWKRCVQGASRDLRLIDPARVFEVRYEDFVHRPAEHVQRVLSFLRLRASDAQIGRAIEAVSTRSVGRWKKRLDKDLAGRVERVAGDTLRRLGYLSKAAA